MREKNNTPTKLSTNLIILQSEKIINKMLPPKWTL